MNNNFIELVKNNPNLPIFALVNSEVVCDDGYAYWYGQFDTAEVREYARVENYEQLVFKDDPDDYKEWLCDNDKYIDLSDEEYDIEFQKIIDNLIFKKAIFVYVGLPDNL